MPYLWYFVLWTVDGLTVYTVDSVWTGGLELAASHGMPVTPELASMLGCNKLEVEPISNSALCSCVSWPFLSVVEIHSSRFNILMAQ